LQWLHSIHKNKWKGEWAVQCLRQSRRVLLHVRVADDPCQVTSRPLMGLEEESKCTWPVSLRMMALGINVNRASCWSEHSCHPKRVCVCCVRKKSIRKRGIEGEEGRNRKEGNREEEVVGGCQIGSRSHNRWCVLECAGCVSTPVQTKFRAIQLE